MSHDVEKDTFINADEKTTKMLTYDMLKGIRESVERIVIVHDTHLEICRVRFDKIEKRKKTDRAISAGSGFLGGFAAVVTTWLKNLL